MLERTEEVKILLMGVSGVGKSTLGNMLSQKLGIDLLEGDDFHPKANIEKIGKGQPLTDQDRLPWLKSIAKAILKQNNHDLIVTCSALKQSYRNILMPNRNEWLCIYLTGPKELIRIRLLKRSRHYFNPNLLGSQLAILEEPKNALALNVSHPPKYLISQIIQVLSGSSN